MTTSLRKAYKTKNLILFVGAGLSKNLELPSWNALIGHLAEKLGYNPDIFHTYGDYQSLAEYYAIEKGGIGELRQWMDNSWHSGMADKVKKSNIYRLLVELDFPIIYTTNYDNSIETAYDLHNRDYIKVTNVNDIRNIENNKCQIVKFHGDFSQDDSIVLTESSYFERLNFESPLDIKFRSDVLGKSILFIGYSLSDINIRFIFYKLSKIWEDSGHQDHRPPAFLFTHKTNPIQEVILKKRGITMISSDKDDPAEALLKLFDELSP